MPENEGMSEPSITPTEIAVLNAARAVLDEIEHRMHFDGNSQSSGLVMAHAGTAGDGIFDLLNVYNSHHGGQLTEAQLHNKPEEPALNPSHRNDGFVRA